MSFPRYEHYKDSGVEWLGEVPAGWGVMALRTLAREGRNTFIDGDWIETPFITDEGVRLIQTGNIGVGFYKEQGFRYISDKTFHDLGCTEVEPGNVLICRLAEPVGRACQAPSLGVKMITSVDVCILKPSEGVCESFVVYLCSSAQYLGFMEGQCRGGTRDRVSRSFLGAVRVPVPPLPEQQAIAAFLDRETAKIDALVAEQEKLITLLKEKRQAVISHAVTKGLDPNARMKDSGIEWLGEVPEGWEVVPIKHIGWLKGGAGFPHDEQGVEGEELSFHKVNALAQAGDDGVLLPSENTISRETASRLGAYIFPQMSIVFAKVGAALLLGRIRVISDASCLDNNMMGLVVKEDNAVNFVRYAMSLVRFDLISNPGTVPSLNESQIGNFRLAIPQKDEQHTITAFIDRETTKLDTLTAEAQRAIALLQERRTALISAAVTGKIDVRGLAPQEAA